MQIFGLCLIFFMIGSSLSCICLRDPELRMDYCRSNFAIRGNAKSVSIPNGRFSDRFYSVEVMEIYKAPSNVKVGDVLTGVTDGTSCGADMWMNKDHLIIGTLNGTTYRFDVCTFFELFEEVDANELTILETGIKC